MNRIIEKLKNRMISLIELDFDVDMRDELFSQINHELYLGSRPKPTQIEMLKKAGITHIISCLNIEKQPTVEFLERDFETLFLPVKDGINEDITPVFAEFFDFISTSQNRSPRAKFLVHCEVGVSRSATLVLALLMEREHKSFFDAFTDLRLKRPKILPNIGFASQLQKFERTYKNTKKTNGKASSLAQYLHQICSVPAEIEVIQTMLEAHNYNALAAIQTIFGEDIPRAIQGVRL